MLLAVFCVTLRPAGFVGSGDLRNKTFERREHVHPYLHPFYIYSIDLKHTGRTVEPNVAERIIWPGGVYIVDYNHAVSDDLLCTHTHTHSPTYCPGYCSDCLRLARQSKPSINKSSFVHQNAITGTQSNLKDLVAVPQRDKPRRRVCHGAGCRNKPCWAC